MDCVISELCYKGTTLQRNYKKMTISWSFRYNSFVIFHGKTIWEPQHVLYPNPCSNEVCYNRTVPYLPSIYRLAGKGK